ncbi:MAG: hypothetical protein HFJ25_01960, partial [Clostridia bacterium]|nr:hypothetical protein [Clostridia bacterium]
MKKFGNILWGLVFIVLGLVLGLNAMGITDIDIFFRGWWTLFIIIPCFIGIFREREKIGNLIGCLIGVALLCCCQGILDFDLMWKLLVPTVLVVVGLCFIFREAIGGKINQEIKNLNANK